jgi:hypothetical protein
VTTTPLGTLESPSTAVVDERGKVTPWAGGWSLDWSVGADDRWHVPAQEVAVRQRLVDGMPVVETAMRVPGGDAVHRAYGVRAGDDDLVVVEVENQSPLPFAIALVPSERADVDGSVVRVKRRVAMHLLRPPSRVENQQLIWPVAHRTTFRVALRLLPQRRADAVDVAALASAASVARGWRLHGDRGTRLELPDPRLQAAVDANRRYQLLRPSRALSVEGGLDHVRLLLDSASTTWTWADGTAGAELLALVGEVLVHELGPNRLSLLTEVPPAWLGQPLQVSDMPTAAGSLSYAVRWHGERPALLWELSPSGGPVTITAPGLDPSWSTTEPSGEALLAPVPVPVPATRVTIKRSGP